MINVPELRKQLEWITDNPTMHKQKVWLEKTECGTAGCLAGNTVVHCRPELIDWPENSAIGDMPLLKSGQEYLSWEDVAQDILGLNTVQAFEMFGATNTLWQLWALAEIYTDGEITVPPGIEPNMGGGTTFSPETRNSIEEMYDKAMQRDIR